MTSREPPDIRPGIGRLLRLGNRQRSVRRDVDEEIGTHLDLHARWLAQRGMPMDQARREAERLFGTLAVARPRLHRAAEERTRALRWRQSLTEARDDLLFAWREVRRNPGMTVVATAILGIGLGINAAVFSIFDSVVVRPLPYRDPERLTVVWRTQTAASDLSAAVFDTHRDATDWVSHSHSFDGLAEATWALGPQVYHPANAPPREVVAIPVSRNFFDLLGVQPATGRDFAQDDLTRHCVVIVSHAFWHTWLNEDPSALNRPISLGGSSCDLVGVMPHNFEFYPRQTDVWMLMNSSSDTTLLRHPGNYPVAVFGRLRRGIGGEAAQRELRAIYARSPGLSQAERSLIPTVFNLQEEFTWLAGRNLRKTLEVMVAAVGLVLLVVCVNIANLSLSRAMTRQREFAIRSALGSGRARMLRQLLIESALWAAMGMCLGLVVATVAVRYVNGGSLIELPPGGEARLGIGVTAILVALGILVTIVIGIIPGVWATHVEPAQSLKSSGRTVTTGGGRMAAALVVTQVALSVALLVAAGLVVRSLDKIDAAPLGYSPSNVLTMRMSLVAADTVVQRRFYRTVVESVAAETGGAVALTSRLPVEGTGARSSVEVDGESSVAADSVADVGLQVISPSYFSVMQVPIIAGRPFGAPDADGAAAVVIVNRAFALRHFGKANAIGRRVRLRNGDVAEPWLTVVGEVGDERRAIVTHEMGWVSPPMLYRPAAQSASVRSMIAVIRTGRRDEAVAQETVFAVHRVDPDVIVGEILPMSALIDRLLAPPRTRARLLAALASLSLALAVLGLYGLLSQNATQRTREIGIRIALGARSSQVVRLIVSQGVVLTTLGAAAGCSLAIPLAESMRALLYGVSLFDPLTVSGTISCLVLTATVASVVPAHRAAGVDPMVALRSP